MLSMLPVAAAATVPLTVYVTVAPTGRLTVSLIAPVPDAAQLPPPVAVHVQLAPTSDAGTLSTIVAPATADGPLFEAVTV